MARKKEIRRQQILDVAYNLALSEGIESLTARNIAQAGDFSTQPIYLEFKNMEDLRTQVLEIISVNLKTKILQKSYTGGALIDLDLSYINFAKEHVDLFRAMFVDGKLGSAIIADTLLNLGIEKFNEEYSKYNLSEKKTKQVVMTNWISATGIAALIINQVATFSEEQIVNVLKAQILDAIDNENLSQVENNPMFSTSDKE